MPLWTTRRPTPSDFEEIASNLHLQHYLYTLAEEALHPERKVDEAGYLLLAANDGECYAEEREVRHVEREAAKRTEALIRILSDEERRRPARRAIDWTETN